MTEEEEVVARTEKVMRIQRVFINLLDSYSSRNIGKFLSNCVVGASLEEITEEEEEEDENKSMMPEASSPRLKEGTFQVVGTLSTPPREPEPDFAVETYRAISREDLLMRLLECDIIIYNINENPQQVEEAIWAVSALNEEVSHIEKRKMFILISTVMTWARSKSLDPDDSEIPFTEEDYRRRKHHPNFLDHINAEKMVLKLGKNIKKLVTYVVAAGLQYGMEGGILHSFFKVWLCLCSSRGLRSGGVEKKSDKSETNSASERRVFQTSTEETESSKAENGREGAPGLGAHVLYVMAEEGLSNDVTLQIILPTLTLLEMERDNLLKHQPPCCRVIQNIIDHMPKHHYLVAVDESIHTLEDLVKCISKHTGPGKIQKVPRENAFLTKDLTQESIDHLLVNLRMEALFVKENFNIRWVAQTGFVENINSILKEYKQSRGLLPIKICILGPPAVGKSSIAEVLSKYYKLHHIKLKDVISEAIAKLEAIVAPKYGGEGEEEGEEEEEEENVEDAQELLDGIKESMEQNAGRLEDQYIIRFIKEKLKSMPCRNQGYILDGFPKTYDQAKDLFNQEDEEEEEEVRGKMFPFDKVIIPALSNYRDINTEDETVFNYFDELEIHPIHIDVGKLEDAQNRLATTRLIKEIGKPRNYGLTDEEKVEEERRAAEEHIAKEAMQEAEREHKEAMEMAEKIARWEEWNKRLEEVKREETELLEAQSIPLRNYLMTYVMPTLMQGLNECCKVRPEDPVDFLAEYLFKNNPETQ
ncbi:adenylate kinase 7 [Pteropus vampyrus]|uniref:Adenylate kinase 7 n=1 Tax=Pteropus vampyrus TaxID=132908 RepID=A0A6P6CYN1_PTEVA|nr:adenylate kinase 7 [Pteropus vampyrus]